MFKNVVVGISGGVDSAVAALLLKNKGFNVIGVFMKNWDIVEEKGTCILEKDYADAKWVCEKLKIPFFEENFVKEYWHNVFSHALKSYETGLATNPDVLCNRRIKFDRFFDVARSQYGADAVATGHYVRTTFGAYLEGFQSDKNVRLLRSYDKRKDQTLFLCQVPQKSLRYCMFPVGDYLKADVKRIATEAGLNLIAKKKESVGICFVGKRNFSNFISEYINDNPGDFVHLDSGRVLARHRGFHHWTVGQKCKLGGGKFPYYVFQKDIETNNIIVVQTIIHPALYSNFLIMESFHWISSEPEEFKDGFKILHCSFRFQHANPSVPCQVYRTQTNRLLIELNEPLRAITKGQFGVLYRQDECLGGGTITYTGPSYFALNRQLNVENMKLPKHAELFLVEMEARKYRCAV